MAQAIIYRSPKETKEKELKEKRTKGTREGTKGP